MNLRKPIPLFIKWHETKVATWIRRHDPFLWSLGGEGDPMTFIIYFAICGIGLLYLSGTAGLIFSIVTLILLPILNIFYFTAVSKPPEYAVKPLTSEEKRAISKSFQQKVRNK
jgi:hypothetical protein